MNEIFFYGRHLSEFDNIILGIHFLIFNVSQEKKKRKKIVYCIDIFYVPGKAFVKFLKNTQKIQKKKHDHMVKLT